MPWHSPVELPRDSVHETIENVNNLALKTDESLRNLAGHMANLADHMANHERRITGVEG